MNQKIWRLFSIGLFFVTLGLGWYIFPKIQISGNTIAWVLLICGLSLIISSLLSLIRWLHPARGLFVGVIGGLLVSLIFTSSLGFSQFFQLS